MEIKRDARLEGYKKLAGRRKRKVGTAKSGVPWRSAAFALCCDVISCLYPSSSSICAGLSAAFTLSIALTMIPFSSIRYVVRTTPMETFP